MNSLIKYYGGKSFMTTTILNNFPKKYSIYIEGFGGGGSVLFDKEPDSIEVYNDLDRNVHSIFKVLHDEELFSKFRDSLLTTPYSRNIREEYKESLKENLSTLDRAIRFFYVNRTSFNGVGGFSVNLLSRRGMSKSVSDYLSSVDKLNAYNERVSRVIVENLDIFDLIEKYDGKDTFFYLDPPYVKQTRASNQKYLVEFSDEEHKKLVDTCNNLKGKVLISGYDHPIYDKLKDFNKISFKSNNSNSNAQEILWKNY